MVFFSIVCLSYENFIKKNMKLIEVCLLLVAIWGWGGGGGGDDDFHIPPSSSLFPGPPLNPNVLCVASVSHTHTPGGFPLPQ
jgi:hypothetical protein